MKYTLPEKMSYLESKSLLRVIEAYTYHICSDSPELKHWSISNNTCTMVLSNDIEISSKNGSPVVYEYITLDKRIIQRSCYKELLKAMTVKNSNANIV